MLYPLSYTHRVRLVTLLRQNPFTEHTSLTRTGAVCAAGPDGSCRQKQKAPSALSREGALDRADFSANLRSRDTSGACAERGEQLFDRVFHVEKGA